MSAPAQYAVRHHDGCWRHHDPCALRRAREVLEHTESRESTASVRTRDLLAVVRMAIRAHTPGAPCPDGHRCIAVRMARGFLGAGMTATPACRPISLNRSRS